MRRLRPREKVVAALGAGAVSVALVMFAKQTFASRATRQNPGPGRTAVIGDSIVAHTAGFVRYLDQNVQGRSFTNFGVVGQGTAAIRQDLRTRVIGRGFDEVIVEGGMNDMGRNDAVSYIVSNLRSMVQEAKAAGLKVVLVTITPYYLVKPKIAEVNAIILRDGRSWGADAVVDTHAPLRTLGTELRSDYASADRLHPNRAGQQAIGQAILERAYSL